MSILIFFGVLFVLILVHEWGHFIVAKKTGMRVDEFGIGFPPKVFGIKKGETEYTLNALPIGGFVKIFGEDAESAGQKDFERSFISKSKWAQAAVLLAGVTMNVIFAWFLFVVVLMVGVPTAIEEDAATASARLVVAEVVEDTPAARAGLVSGAEILAFRSSDREVSSLLPSEVKYFIENNEALEVTFKSDGTEQTVVINPETNIIPDQPEKVAIGVAFALVDTVQQPFITALKEATVRTVTTLGAITVGLTSLIADSVVGKADFSQVAGPIGIVGLVGDAAEFGFTSLLLFTAIISLNLAVINMLPFPALDGGRLLFVGIEAVIRRPINPVWVGRLNMIGFSLLILLMVAVTYNDVLRLL